MLQIVFHPKANKEFLRLPAKIRRQILDQLSGLETLNHPLQHHKVIKLKAQSHENFRLRVGDYRIKFTFRNFNQILITHVQHRQAGY